MASILASSYSDAVARRDFDRLRNSVVSSDRFTMAFPFCIEPGARALAPRPRRR